MHLAMETHLGSLMITCSRRYQIWLIGAKPGKHLLSSDRQSFPLMLPGRTTHLITEIKSHDLIDALTGCLPTKCGKYASHSGEIPPTKTLWLLGVREKGLLNRWVRKRYQRYPNPSTIVPAILR